MHHLGRDYGGARAALSRVRAEVTVAGISSDRLYPLRLQHELATLLGAGEVQVVESGVGHDGFLVEHEAVGALVRKGARLAPPRAPPGRRSLGQQVAKPKGDPAGKGRHRAEAHENSSCHPVRRHSRAAAIWWKTEVSSTKWLSPTTPPTSSTRKDHTSRP